jgi:hypothetical protein
VYGESRAWCEAWTGDWWPSDPTNAVAVGERHLPVARGRGYRDVPPLKGIVSGAPSTTPVVSVELTRHLSEHGVSCVRCCCQGSLGAQCSGPQVLVKVERPQRSEDERHPLCQPLCGKFFCLGGFASLQGAV